VSSTEVIQRAVVPTLQVEFPMAVVTVCNLDPSVGEECRNADLDTTGEGSRSMDLKATRIIPKVVAATWKVH
jgi:hypothetical protein